MGKDGEVKSVKAGKSSFTVDPKGPTNQANFHVYPDWAAVQAYHGPRVPMPAFYNSQAAPGHASHPFMWAPPQIMMSPYGAPYAAMYAHGSVYTHPAVPPTANPSSVETPTKSSGNTDRDLVKKSKEIDALEMSIGNGNAEDAEGEVDHSLSKSSSAAEASSSDGNTSRANQSKRKRGREATCTTVVAVARDQKPEIQASMPSTNELKTAFNKKLDITVAAVGVPANLVGPAESCGLTNVLKLKNLSSLNLAGSKSQQPIAVTPPETWLEDDRELKKEKRKQSNRDSARRSRLRKQAETEELAQKVEALNADNESLKSEINQISESSVRLKIENSSLMVIKMPYYLHVVDVCIVGIFMSCADLVLFAISGETEKARLGRMEEIFMNTEGAVTTKNLLSKVDNSGALTRDAEDESTMYEKNAGAKLHQLLDARLRTDAIAAS